MSRLRSGKRRRAFTLLELIVVCVIIAILAVVVIASYKAVTDRSYRATLVASGQNFEEEARTLAGMDQAAPASYVTTAAADMPTGWAIANGATDLQKVLMTRSDGAWVCLYLGGDSHERGTVTAVGRVSAPATADNCAGSSWSDTPSAPPISSAAGTVDSSFGSGGTIFPALGSGASEVKGLVVQPDGKLIAVGYRTGADGTTDFAVYRYLTNGALDPSFGTGGSAVEPFGIDINDQAHSVALQWDGRIVVTGFADDTTSYTAPSLVAVVRYTIFGKLDPSFGSGGVVTANVGGVDVTGNTVLVQTDGKIVVAGSTVQPAAPDYVLLRYTTSGVLDSSFGSNGSAPGPSSTLRGLQHTAALQSDGKILVAGDIAQPGLPDSFAVARYTSTGALDSTFGTNGLVITSFGTATTANAYAFGIVVQPDRKIVLAGYGPGYVQNFDLEIVRYMPNGTQDPSFGTNGVVTTEAPDPTIYCNTALSLALQPDGKIVTAGYVEQYASASGSAPGASGHPGSPSDQAQRFAVSRYTTSGALDPSFGSGGRMSYIFVDGVGHDANANAVAIQSDGKIIAGGFAIDTSSQRDWAILRVQ